MTPPSAGGGDPQKGDQGPRVAAGIPRRGHAGPGAPDAAYDPALAQLYNDVSTMIADGRLDPDNLLPPPGEAALLWSLPAETGRRAYTALERDGWIARCPHCGQWAVTPLKSCIPPP